MKIKVVNGLFLKSEINEENSLYALDIKILAGKSVLIGQSYKCIENPNLFFKVKNLALGGYDFENNIFSIQIEKPTLPVNEYKDKTFNLE